MAEQFELPLNEAGELPLNDPRRDVVAMDASESAAVPITPAVVRAALLLEHHFIKHGVKAWKLMGVQSRQAAELSECGTRDSRIETAAQSRPSLH